MRLGPRPIQPPLERFFKNVSLQPDGCWQWISPIGGSGYGYFAVRGHNYRAHRWLWIQMFGGLPDGFDLDHLCRNRLCVNPEHLDPVTRRENLRRGMGGQLTRQRAELVTHCPKGHPYDAANTSLKPTRWGFSRRCKACAADYTRERYRASKGGAVRPYRKRRSA